MWIALIPPLAWGSIGLISGKLGGNANQQTLGMTWGLCSLQSRNDNSCSRKLFSK